MVLAAREILVSAGRDGRTVTYGDLARDVSGARLSARSRGLMALLDEACEPVDAEYGIALASLVVRADTRMPGDGYFEWAAHSGRDVIDREAMWRREVERVRAALARRQEDL